MSGCGKLAPYRKFMSVSGCLKRWYLGNSLYFRVCVYHYKYCISIKKKRFNLSCISFVLL